MIPLATLFTHPIELASQLLWMIIPVSIAVAIVYKTLRVTSLRHLPMAIVKLSLLILAGETAVLLAGWVIVRWIL